MKEFSIVLTTHMQDKFIRAAIESVLGQTFKDFELIIIDDGSTDNTKDIVDQIKDSRIKYYYQSKSGLPAAARNSGIKKSNGRYIAFLDADDIWYPEKLYKCHEIFKQYPDINLVCHNEVMKDVSGRIIKILSYGPYVPEMFRRLLFKGNCLSPSATVVKKDALLDEGLLYREYPEFFSVEDYDLWLRLSKKHKFYFIPEVLGEYFLHDRNISSNIERHHNNHITIIRKNFKEYEDKKIFDFFLINFRISKIYFIISKYFIQKKKIRKAFKYSLKALLQFFAYVQE